LFEPKMDDLEPSKLFLLFFLSSEGFF